MIEKIYTKHIENNNYGLQSLHIKNTHTHTLRDLILEAAHDQIQGVIHLILEAAHEIQDVILTLLIDIKN